MLRSVQEAIPPVHREGWLFIAIAAALAVVLSFVSTSLFWILAILTGWMVIFFRDPVRVVPTAPGLVVSPADGRVEPVVSAPPPPELGLGTAPLTRISVFMNVFDCHINRAPVAGRVAKIAYKRGRFLSADLDKASEHNERNSVLLETGDGLKVGVVQIAGLVARRILCWSEEGEELATGARFGMIRFGSRLDIYLPEGAVPTVSAGQRAIAGETIIAHLPGAAFKPPMPTRRD